jgi:hypothetical protein
MKHEIFQIFVDSIHFCFCRLPCGYNNEAAYFRTMSKFFHHFHPFTLPPPLPPPPNSLALSIWNKPCGYCTDRIWSDSAPPWHTSCTGLWGRAGVDVVMWMCPHPAPAHGWHIRRMCAGRDISQDIALAYPGPCSQCKPVRTTSQFVISHSLLSLSLLWRHANSHILNVLIVQEAISVQALEHWESACFYPYITLTISLPMSQISDI